MKRELCVYITEPERKQRLYNERHFSEERYWNG
jgi:hypothetical protein